MNTESAKSIATAEGRINDNRVALVTGGARRIGAALVEALHTHGYRVLIHYRRSADAADTLAARLNRARPDSAHCVQADLESVAEVEQLAAAARTRWGRVDVLINNASDFYPTPIGSATLADWQRLMGSNLQGPFFLIQALLAELRAAKGCIINLVDIHASRPLAEHPIYCAAKAGLAMLTQALARDLGPEVRVNGIAPGAILWPEQPGSAASQPGESVPQPIPLAGVHPSTFTSTEQSLIDRIPARRTGDPQDIVRTALFLIEDAPYITGQIIAVDGGRSQI